MQSKFGADLLALLVSGVDIATSATANFAAWSSRPIHLCTNRASPHGIAGFLFGSCIAVAVAGAILSEAS
jgi:hypothetical protein